MRIVGRYFTTGATLGSISALATLVLIWSWMTLHLGIFGFLVGWIPAGIIAAAIWLTMVVFWAPILVIGALIAIVVLALAGRHHHQRDWETPPAISPPETAAPPVEEAPRPADTPPPADAAPPPPPTVASPPADLPPPAERAAPPAAAAPQPIVPPAVPAPAPAARPPKARPNDDLGSDAAAAGDTSHKHPQ